VEVAYSSRNEKGKWGLVLGGQAQSTVINLITISFIYMFKKIMELSFSSSVFSGWYVEWFG
jgi:hypothetical protein